MKKSILFILAFSYTSVYARCEFPDGMSFVEMREYLARTYQKYDKNLNQNYQRAIKICNKTNKKTQCKNRLQAMESNWIKYKEATEKFISFYETDIVGYGHSEAVLMFLCEETKKQNQLLKDFISRLQN